MKGHLITIIFVVFTLNTTIAQKNLVKIPAYWGAITDLSVTVEELASFESISVHDTLKNRNIKWISKFRFYVQPAQTGPVKVAMSSGPFINNQMKQYITNPKPGDKIVISEIIGYVENEGVRQIPTAIVLVVR